MSPELMGCFLMKPEKLIYISPGKENDIVSKAIVNIY